LAAHALALIGTGNVHGLPPVAVAITPVGTGSGRGAGRSHKSLSHERDDEKPNQDLDVGVCHLFAASADYGRETTVSATLMATAEQKARTVLSSISSATFCGVSFIK
jgi:hypothetical protein